MNGGIAASGPLQRGDRILDKYEVRGLLGKGGHAFVYDCFNAFLAEEVAIKLIPNLHRGNQLLKRARGEAQVLYRLNHPNVVRVMDGGEFNGMVYIVMEKLDGVSLRQLLRQRKALPVDEALLIALQVAEALEAAHAMNVIHRDLKPDNIFLLSENHVKVLDFGIAKFLDGHQTTQKDLIQGTAPYMSPEQAQGLGVTFASDIFQLGTLLYEMIAGVCPCMVDVEDVTLQELVAIQISKLPPRLKHLVRGVPDYVDRLVWRAIAKQAQQRFTTMPELTAAIRTALERLGVDLPSERLHRANAVRRNSSRPPRPDAEFERPAARSTPFALATPKVASHPPERLDEKTEPMPDGPPSSVPPRANALLAPRASISKRASPSVRPWAPTSSVAAQSARLVLLRAALLGAIAAVPVGLVVGLARRRPPSSTTVAAAARAASPMPVFAAVPPSSPALGAPASSPLTIVPTATSPVGRPSAARATTVHSESQPANVPAKPTLRIVTVQAASGLDPVAPRASAATTSSSPPPTRVAPKSIF